MIIIRLLSFNETKRMKPAIRPKMWTIKDLRKCDNETLAQQMNKSLV